MGAVVITEITLPCVKDGDNVFVFTDVGKTKVILTAIRHPMIIDAVKIEDKKYSKGKWGNACHSMRNRLAGDISRASTDKWNTWAAIRQKTISKRRNYQPSIEKRQFSNETRPNWKSSFRSMRQQLSSSYSRAISNRWDLWGANTSKNLNRRYKGKWGIL